MQNVFRIIHPVFTISSFDRIFVFFSHSVFRLAPTRFHTAMEYVCWPLGLRVSSYREKFDISVFA